MREGEVIREFEARGGRRVALRAPKWSDVDGFLAFINSLHEEGAMIGSSHSYTREQEMDFVAKLLRMVETGDGVSVVAEADGRLVGHVEVTRRGRGYTSHMGALGISIIEGYREAGIGQELMKEAEAQSRRIGLESVMLEVYATNPRAIHVYEKSGYAHTGAIPKGIKRDGGYVDVLVMVKQL